MTDSTETHDLLELERDLPTTAEDIKVLWELSRRPVTTLPRHANRLRDPYWSLEKALTAPLFSDRDAPFHL